MSVPTLDNLGISIPCCQLCSVRDVHCCGVHAFSVIVGVGGCQGRSACRVCNSAASISIPVEERREPSTRKRQETKTASFPLFKKIDVLLVGLFTVSTLHCERLSQARDGSNFVRRDFTLVFIERN